MIEQIEIPDIVKSRITELLNAQRSLELQLRSYLQGFQDGRGLTGNWNLDVDKWMLTPIEESQEEPQ